MADPYSNPDYTPPVGTYTWVPNFTPSGSTPAGPAFDTLKLERGEFQNELPARDGLTGLYTTSYGGTRSSPEASEDWPLLAAFRPLANPSVDRGAPPEKPFITQGGDCFWEVTMGTSMRLSSISMVYSLTIDPTDPDLLRYIIGVTDAEKDAEAIAAYQAAKQKDPTVEPPLDVDWTKYAFGKLEGLDASGTATEYPVVIAGATPVQIALTGRAAVGSVSTALPTTMVTIHFGITPTVDGYPTLQAVRISNRYGLTTLRLNLQKVMLFEAARVNIDDAQLPCKLLQYATEINFNVDPSNQQSTWPGGLAGPNFHLKVFSPDYREGSPGFAHSIELRFLIFSLPIFGLSAQDFDTGTSSAYMTVFAGIVAGKRFLRFSFLPQADNGTFGRAVPLDAATVLDQTQSLRLERGARGATAPAADDASWQKLAEYVIGAPPSFDRGGTWPAPYLYRDSTGSADAWYRVIQELQNGTIQTGDPFQSQIYTERTPLQMADSALPVANSAAQTIVRRVPLASAYPQGDVLQADPLAIWVEEDGDPFAGDITVAQGSWTLSLRASSDDTSFLLSTYLLARLWFIPEGEAIDPADPHHWRSATEICFKQGTDGTITMARETPTDISQIIVSPPLPGTLTALELVRYLSSEVTIPAPFADQRARLVVGLYAAGYPTAEGSAQAIQPVDRNFPHLTLDIDSAYASLETPLYQVLSGRILPERASRFTSASYQALSQPLLVTGALSGGGTLAPGTSDYALYRKTFRSGTAAAGDAFMSLLALRGGTGLTAAKLCLPVTEVGLTATEETGAVSADFVTDGRSLGSGRIGAGHWKLRLQASRGADTAKIAYDMRVEAFLVTRDGAVMERIFRSARFAGLSSTGSSNQIVYETDVTIPFLIGAAETQLVLRVWVYPYSRSGDAVDLEAVQADLGTLPLGLRLDSLSLDQHTASWLTITQTASFAGSPAFYEDLQMVSPQSFTTNDFTFVVDSEISGKISITFSDFGFQFTGTLYSPIWFVRLPQGMEVAVAMAGLNSSNNVSFRTVIDDSKSATGGEEGISAAEDRMMGTVHVVYEGTDDSADAADSSAPVVHHIRQDATGRPPRDDVMVMGQAGTAIAPLSGSAPSVGLIRSETGAGTPATVGIVAQIDEEEYNSFTTALSFSSGAPRDWRRPNRIDLTDRTFTDTRRVTQGMKHPAIAPSPLNSLMYVAGWADPGTILVKEVDLFNAGKGGAIAPGTIFVVDGDKDVLLPTDRTIVWPADGNLNGTARETFPGIAWDGEGRMVVAYVLEGFDGYLFARASVGGQAFGPAHVIANIRLQGTSGSGDLAISGPALCWHAATQSLHAAFWVGGKILVTRIVGGPAVGGVLLAPLQLVGGSTDLAAGTGAADGALLTLRTAGNLRLDRAGANEEDVPQQRVGFFASDSWPGQGNLFVYYRDATGALKAREVAPGGLVGDALVLREAAGTE